MFYLLSLLLLYYIPFTAKIKPSLVFWAKIQYIFVVGINIAIPDSRCTMFKKSLFLTIIIAAALCLLPLYALSDIEGHWAKPYIDELVADGTLSGHPDGSFKPEDNTTIGEFLKICIKAFTAEDVQNGVVGDWALPFYQKMMELKYVSAYDEDLVKLTKPITRAQVARILGRIALEKYPSFTDQIHSEASKIDDFYLLEERDRYGVCFMLRLGVITGYNDKTFRGGNNLTRAELSAMISRFKNPKPAEANESFRALKIREGDGINTNYFTVIVDYNKELGPQMKALEDYLDDKVAIEELKDIMIYIGLKKDADSALPMRIYKWKRGDIKVEGLKGTGILTIISD